MSHMKLPLELAFCILLLNVTFMNCKAYRLVGMIQPSINADDDRTKELYDDILSHVDDYFDGERAYYHHLPPNSAKAKLSLKSGGIVSPGRSMYYADAIRNRQQDQRLENSRIRRSATNLKREFHPATKFSVSRKKVSAGRNSI